MAKELFFYKSDRKTKGKKVLQYFKIGQHTPESGYRALSIDKTQVLFVAERNKEYVSGSFAQKAADAENAPEKAELAVVAVFYIGYERKIYFFGLAAFFPVAVKQMQHMFRLFLPCLLTPARRDMRSLLAQPVS